MDTPAVIILVATAVLVVIGAVVLARGRHPGQAAIEEEPPSDSTSDRFYRGADRPAGPDAEL